MHNIKIAKLITMKIKYKISLINWVHLNLQPIKKFCKSTY